MLGIKTPKLDMRKEFERRKSQSQRILELLQKGECTNIDLQKIALNYTMRVSELRKDGHKIVSIYEKPGVYRYVYLGQDDD